MWSDPKLEHGMASKVRKGEDKSAIVATGDVTVVGVFDGHGGAELAEVLADTLPGILAGLGPRPAVEDIVEAYYAVDADLGQRFITEGSTASCAVVRRDAISASVSLSWVGDSRVIEVDVVEGAKVWESSSHHVKNPEEVARIALQALVRDGEKLLPDDPIGRVVARSLQYEQVLLHVDIARGIHRRETTIEQREMPDGRLGPLVVQTNLAVGKSGRRVVKAASTQVTRSIGDWDSARTIIPHPDCATMTYTLDDRNTPVWRRFVLASDGLWDVVDAERATKLVAHLETPQQAAVALLNAARKAYARSFPGVADPFRDDTTVVCFDVRLGNPKPTRRGPLDSLLVRFSGRRSKAVPRKPSRASPLPS